LETIQRQLSEYLQCELYHLLGAYGVAEELLRGLRTRIPSGDEEQAGAAAATLTRLADVSQDFNRRLRKQRYATDPRSRLHPSRPHSEFPESWPVREPMPRDLEMTEINRFSVGPRDTSMGMTRFAPWTSDEDWGWIARYYCEAIAALEAHVEVIGSKEDRYQEAENDDRARQINFARSLLARRDGESKNHSVRAAHEHLDRRIDRYTQRLKWAVAHIGAKHGGTEKHILEGLGIKKGERKPADEKFLRMIMEDQPPSGEESLSVFVLRVQAEAHLSMHAVEAWRSMCIGENAKTLGEDQKDWLERELDRSIALDTFTFCVGRTAPWLFARGEAQRRSVVEDVATAWENVVPLRCMWIASQVSLLALHRRAYARALKRAPASAAYNDYHKLQYLIRDTERRIEGAPLHVAGASGFLAGLNAEAHHHIGELYRAEHAHKPALEHFEAATHRLELLRKEDAAFDEVLTNSRWYVELKISRGKACYEMGRHKEALCWHLKAWLAFLELLSSETETAANTKDTVAAIEWLESVKFEPELRKAEITEWIYPVISQFDRISPVGRVGALAAEILLRLGHLLFVLNIGDDEGSPQDQVRSTLAFACLSKAIECDPYSTLIGADMLKMRFRFNRRVGRPLSRGFEKALAAPDLRPIDQHWPRGGSDYERLARTAEFLMLMSRKGRFSKRLKGVDPLEVDGLVARDLLLDLFMSTDSINVRKSQIHRFLMEPRASTQLPCEEDGAALEFVGMRRYSSPFPLLPRPSAFRALGGGYFIRLHRPKRKGLEREDGYGIVVDPGVDFVENLYRTGFSLADVNMIVITHDHVDHLGALDPLLSLLHVRSEILAKEDERGQEQSPEDKVAVLTSRSVKQRYQHVSKLSARKAKNFTFHCFEDGARKANGALRLPKKVAFPDEFEILTMDSTAGGSPEDKEAKRDGHRDLSNGPSHGVCVRRKGRPNLAVAIASDTPPPPPESEKARRQEWERAWKPALEAGVLVAHLGSVPLTELRRMDDFEGEGLRVRERQALADQERVLRDLREKLQGADPDLRGQIEYAQWLRSHLPDPDGEEPLIAEIVGSVSDRWLPPPEHNYLEGLLRWARRYRKRWAPSGTRRKRTRGPQGLFVIGELSEELGTMRGKVATRLNDMIFEAAAGRKAQEDDSNLEVDGFPYALTADIGLRACVSEREGMPCVQVLCTTCNLDTDRTSLESYHPCHDIYEVCVKGENEGIFYNCLEHDPARQDEPAFLEQLERFDIFGR
jgi:tetratricopeptide (TPR) repeat protein